jgi:hypothetical protein
MFSTIILYTIIIVINIFWMLGFFVRLVGVETKKWSTTNSIFQIINLVPRTIGVFQIPLITLYTENAINSKGNIDEFFYQGILIFNLVGVLIGFFLTPVFLTILSNIINNIYDKASFKILFNKDLWKTVDISFEYSSYKFFFTGFNFYKVNYLNLFSSNLAASFLISVAFPACVLAGYYVPVYRATIISSVSIIYGLSTFITILLIDTRVSVFTDKTFHGLLSISQYKMILFDCLKGRFLGIVIGIVFLPYIAKVIVFLVNFLLL